MTTSVYQYITVANLEAFAMDDFSAYNSTTFSDANIEAVITQAERQINNFCGQSFTGTIPDGIIAATLELAYRMLLKRLIKDGYLDITKVHVEVNTVIENDPGLKALLDAYVLRNVKSSIEVFNMPKER